MAEYITIKMNITIDKDKEEDFIKSLEDNPIINNWKLPITSDEIEKLKQEIFNKKLEFQGALKELTDKERELEEIKKEFQIECLEDMKTGKRTYRSVKLLNYKEALDEIEEYRISEINDEDEEENDTILSIINETKEK